MNLENKQIRELLTYASNNGHTVTLYSIVAVVENDDDLKVFIQEGYDSIFIYKGAMDDSCLILPDDFKQLFTR
ncbi:hypothetical protein AA464_08550 [Salmonella enterica subsp. enterica serovar Newport]|nr:hypothetical protein [Salmonella enterica subsp. enterica serovar Newport]